MDDKAGASWTEGNAFRIREMFDLFDKDKSETVVNEEVCIKKIVVFEIKLTAILGWGDYESFRSISDRESTDKRHSTRNAR